MGKKVVDNNGGVCYVIFRLERTEKLEMKLSAIRNTKKMLEKEIAGMGESSQVTIEIIQEMQSKLRDNSIMVFLLSLIKKNIAYNAKMENIK